MTRILILLATVLLVAAGCTQPDPPATWETPSPTGPAPYAGPQAPRLRLTEVWHRDRAGLKSVGPATKVGSRLVLRGTDTDDQDTIMIIDADSGTVLWDEDDLPAELPTDLGRVGPESETSWAEGHSAWAADDGRGGVLILTYRSRPCPDDEAECHGSRITRSVGFGLVAVSLTDRSVRWTSEIIPSRPRDPQDDHPQQPRLEQRIIGVSDSAIAAMTYGANPADDPERSTIAIDPRTGKRLWQAEKLLPTAVAGDRVLALAAVTEIATGTPVVLDGRTGAEVLVLPDADAAWSSIGDGLATITRTRGDEPEPPPVVELSTGRTVLGLPRTSLGSLVLSAASTGAVAWWYDDETLLTQATGDQAPLRASPPDIVDPGVLHRAHGDYVWAETSRGQVALDRTGQVRSDPVPSSAELIGDDLILIDRAGGKPGLTLLRISR